MKKHYKDNTIEKQIATLYGVELEAMKPKLKKRRKCKDSLLAINIGGYMVASGLVVKQRGKNPILKFMFLPSRGRARAYFGFNPEDYTLEPGQILARVVVFKAPDPYSSCLFQFSPVGMPHKVTPLRMAMPPWHVDSNPRACAMLGSFIGEEVSPNLGISLKLKELLPDAAWKSVFAADMPDVGQELKRLPSPVRGTLLAMDALRATLHGVDPVTGMKLEKRPDIPDDAKAADEEVEQVNTDLYEMAKGVTDGPTT